MNDKKILGIVITYKETELCKKAIKSLANTGVDVALVFNGWSEKYLKWLDRFSGYIDYLFLNRNNIGFCRGNNQALSLAISERYDYAFLLNNDAWVEDDCIDILMKEATNYKNVGMLQPKVYKAWDKNILDTTGLIFKYGNIYSWEKGLGYVVDRGQGEYDVGKYDDVQNIIGCCACAVLYNLKMIRCIGKFWERLWSLGEDVELSWRAYINGWKARYTSNAVAYHWRGYTTRRSSVLQCNDLCLLWDSLKYRNWTLTLLKFGNISQRVFTAVMWGYTGVKHHFIDILSKYSLKSNCNRTIWKYVLLCSLALLNRKYLRRMEMSYLNLFSKFGITEIME